MASTFKSDLDCIDMNTVLIIRTLMEDAMELGVESVTVGPIKIVCKAKPKTIELPDELKQTRLDPLNEDLLFYSSE